MDQHSVLCRFLDAKIASAEGELRQAERFYRTSPSPYTAGRVQWAGHQLAALQTARREAENPGQIIERWERQAKGRFAP